MCLSQGGEEPDPSAKAAAGWGLSCLPPCRPGEGQKETGGTGAAQARGGEGPTKCSCWGTETKSESRFPSMSEEISRSRANRNGSCSYIKWPYGAIHEACPTRSVCLLCWIVMFEALHLLASETHRKAVMGGELSRAAGQCRGDRGGWSEGKTEEKTQTVKTLLTVSFILR